MGRSKYIADQAVEMARLCVLKATAAERLAMEAKQEAEYINNRAVARTGVDAARAGYKAAQAGQHATVIGQQAAMWEDPNLPPQDTIRQLEYILRLIDSVTSKAAEVAYRAAQIAPNLGKEDLSKELAKGYAGNQNALIHLISIWTKKAQTAESKDIIEKQTRELTVKQSALKLQVHLSTRKLANILANGDKTDGQKRLKINLEAECLVDFIIKAEEIEKDKEETQVQTIAQKFPPDQENSPIAYYVVKLANQQVVLANYVCALTSLQLSRVSLKNPDMREWDDHTAQTLGTQEDLYVYNNISKRFFGKIVEIIQSIDYIAKQIIDTDDVIFKQSILYKEEPDPMIDMNLISIQEKTKQLSYDIFTPYGKEYKSISRQIDEMMAQAAQAIDQAVAKAAQLIHMDIAIAEAYKVIHSHERIEDMIDQISTLASRVAILAYQERIVVWGEYNDKEKDDPQVLEVVARQAYKVAKEAAQAAEQASQAANRAGQSVTQLIHDLLNGPSLRWFIHDHLLNGPSLRWHVHNLLNKPSRRGNHATQNVLPSDASITISSSLDEIQRMCREADTACKAAWNVYEKIEQERRDAEQFCTKGIIAAQSVSWWPIWPWLLYGGIVYGCGYFDGGPLLHNRGFYQIHLSNRIRLPSNLLKL